MSGRGKGGKELGKGGRLGKGGSIRPTEGSRKRRKALDSDAGSSSDSDSSPRPGSSPTAPVLVRSDALVPGSVESLKLQLEILKSETKTAKTELAAARAETLQLRAELATACAELERLRGQRAEPTAAPDLGAAILELIRNNTGTPLISHGAIAKALKAAHPDGSFKAVTRKVIKDALVSLPIKYHGTETGFTVTPPPPVALPAPDLPVPAVPPTASPAEVAAAVAVLPVSADL